MRAFWVAGDATAESDTVARVRLALDFELAVEYELVAAVSLAVEFLRTLDEPATVAEEEEATAAADCVCLATARFAAREVAAASILLEGGARGRLITATSILDDIYCSPIQFKDVVKPEHTPIYKNFLPRRRYLFLGAERLKSIGNFAVHARSTSSVSRYLISRQPRDNGMARYTAFDTIARESTVLAYVREYLGPPPPSGTDQVILWSGVLIEQVLQLI